MAERKTQDPTQAEMDLLDMLKEICDIQAEWYGNGAKTHMAMKHITDKARKLIAEYEHLSSWDM